MHFDRCVQGVDSLSTFFSVVGLVAAGLVTVAADAGVVLAAAADRSGVLPRALSFSAAGVGLSDICK